MAMAAPKKVKRSKFKKVTFKFSKREYEVLEKCAELEDISINKFVKRNIRNGIDDMMPRLKTWLDQLQPNNQLKLFSDEDEFEKEVIIQKSLVEEYSDFYAENEKNKEL